MACNLQHVHPACIEPAQEYQWTEMFAGTGMATQCVTAAGYRGAKLDIDMGKSDAHPTGAGTSFDFLSSSGFALLGQLP